jgi:hypothetical protein
MEVRRDECRSYTRIGVAADSTPKRLILAHISGSVIPGWSEGPDPESRDSPMCKRTS